MNKKALDWIHSLRLTHFNEQETLATKQWRRMSYEQRGAILYLAFIYGGRSALSPELANKEWHALTPQEKRTLFFCLRKGLNKTDAFLRAISMNELKHKVDNQALALTVDTQGLASSAKLVTKVARDVLH